jgi:hypothetical protein
VLSDPLPVDCTLRSVRRAYLMRGMFISGLGGEYAEAARLQGEAIEILNWGAQKWKNVPYEQKGSVFRPTFIVGAKSMMLEIYLNVRHPL